ncbi:MAG: Arm DNA-binding domain-containing protein, partial [Hyphomicrobiaceae bacterium]
MPRIHITDTALPTLKGERGKETSYTDTETRGFILRVSRAGHRSYILRYSSPTTNKQRRWVIGSPEQQMTVKQARQKATDAIAALSRGNDPQGTVTPSAASVWTCRQLIDRYEAEQERLLAQGELAAGTVYHRKGLLRRTIRPALGDTLVNEVT